MLEKVEVQSLIKTIDKNNGIKRALEKLSIKSEEDFLKYNIVKSSDYSNMIEASLHLCSQVVCSEMRDFANYFWNIVIKEKRKYIEKFSDEIDNIDIFLKSIQNRLEEKTLGICYRIFVYEINYLRVNNRYKSMNEKEQFEEYIKSFLSDQNYYKELGQKYPELFKVVLNEYRKNFDYVIEILKYFRQDKEYIKGLIEKEDKIVSMELGKGDSHNNGRSVTKIKLGNRAIIYYKPRNSQIDKLYHDMIQLYNESVDIKNKIKTLETVSIDEHGWTKAIEFSETKNSEEIKIFYYKLGIQLAYLYMTDAIDFHAENLIANGSDPVLIDLESLFGIKKVYNKEIKSAKDISIKYLSNTVNSTGILPFKFGTNEKSDVSGIGNSEKRESFIKVPKIKNGKTSNLKVEKEYISLSKSNNHPEYKGQPVDEKEYYTFVIDGFIKGYNFIKKHRKEIVRIVDTYKDKIQLRYIPKPTIYYSNLLSLSVHPMVMQASIGREIFFTKLDIDNKDNNLFEYEYRDLLNHDIPYFTYMLDDKSLTTSDLFKVTIEEFWTETAYERMKNKLDSMNELDKNFQVLKIKNSFGILGIKNIHEYKQNNSIATIQEIYERIKVDNSKSVLIQRAEDIAQYLLKISDRFENTYSWISSTVIEQNNRKEWQTDVMGNSLYDGLSGMVFFFLSLYIITGKAEYLKVAEDILQEILLEENSIDNRPIGAFDGIFSIIYVLCYAYVVTKNKKYLVHIDEYLHDTKNIKEWEDNPYDIIGGSAGILLVLLNVEKIYKKLNRNCEEVKKQIIYHVNKICENVVVVNENEVGWIGVDKYPLTGFAHGNSGICYALETFLDNCTWISEDVQKKIKKIIYEGATFELSKREKGKWYDLRTEIKKVENHYPYAWCHGAPGILLGLSYLEDVSFDIEEGLRDLCTNAFGRNHSLCHGDLGNAVIMKDIATHLKSKLWNEAADYFAFRVVNMYQMSEMKIGLGIEMLTPELMVGLAGMGYSLLYIYDNEKLPNILRLEMKGFSK